ncbi:MAG: ImmA/IrrE family metallo-endopeptidase [Nitrosomonadales bacterium]|nr:ImmA/IrrE family metallo-endopeptidase [Nitrosomonadales bacterium]
MTELLEQVIKNRKLLQNPYAHIEYLELAQITASRLLYENPWAHIEDLDELGRLPAQWNANWQKRKNYTIAEIEQHARMLQIAIWQRRDELWHGAVPSNPIELLDPKIALNSIGYVCDEDETLGQFYSDGKMVEVAGIIDGPSKQVRISRQFPNIVRNFTAAHELGHALLHEPRIMHRDRALNGETISRDSCEYEADKFASLFLMPRKQVCASFKQLFLTDMFSLDEATTFALGAAAREMLMKGNTTLRQLSRILADAEQYNGRHFKSLASRFSVSTEAMAIRLEELKLVNL